ncbi:hypothetical protein PVAND_012203 [Polypedilum vanderplanki]|uniref:SKA complex subunit 1 n=1 Tax=Polypedilum vanderplanki TaxID=319348 RepID=A0A9J6CLQ1_POLVA|nr:hypothetical protein PVAND_012203 [Polypedilum vanderplanki]
MELLSDLTSKLKLIEEQFLLISNKSTIKNELATMTKDLVEIKQLQNDIHLVLEQSRNVLLEEYEELKEFIFKTTGLMLYALEQIENKKATTGNNKNEKSPQFLNIPSTSTSTLHHKSPKSPGVMKTPLSSIPASRLAVNIYSKSPLIRKRTTKLMFTDFEAEINEEDFKQIPSYIRGRITISELQNFLNNVLIHCFNQKYEIFYKNRACLTTREFQLQQIFQSQASYFDGYFITVGDLARTQNRNIDKKDEKYLQNLRFLKIIKEERKNSAQCYIWMKKF